MIRQLRWAAPLVALALWSPGSQAAEPFHGFFQPRGGTLYSPLHYWAPAAYKVRYYHKGPECCGSPVSVCPPARPVGGTVVVAPKPVPPPTPAPK